jgi:hypothetical protein
MPRLSYSKPVVIPCPDCQSIESRDYSPFLDWLATSEDMDRLLARVESTPCYRCQAIRKKKAKEAAQGGRPKIQETEG